MATTLLPANPFSDDFSTERDCWTITTPGSSSAGRSSPEGLAFSITEGGDYRWTDSVANAPRAVLPLFTAGAGASMNNFVVQFMVTLTLTGSAGHPSAGGIALLKAADPLTAVPLIEFGGDSSTVRAYHSWGGDMGSVLTVNSPTLPLRVRVVRSDNVIYTAVSTAGSSGPWTTLANTAAQGRLLRSTPDATPLTSFDSLAFYARTKTTTGSGLLVFFREFSITCWPYHAPAVAVGQLRARTNLKGGAVNLSWSNPGGENAPRYLSIWRSRYGHPEYKRPPYVVAPPEGAGFGALGEEIYAGDPVESFADTGLGDDRFYYYTIFATRAPAAPLFSDATLAKYEAMPGDTDWGPQAVSANKVTGWTQRDMAAEEPHAMYNRFPENVRDEAQLDAQSAGSATGYLERYAEFLQYGEAHHRGLVQGFGYIMDPSQAPLGLVGHAIDQTSIVDAFLRERDVADVARLDGITRRRLWEGLIGAYKKKGSIPGIREFINLLTGWREPLVEEPGIGSSLRGFKTWDGLTTREVFTVVGGLTYSAGQVSGFTDLVPDKYAGGLYVDFFGNCKAIASNTATTLTLVDDDWVGYDEIAFTGAVEGSGGSVHWTAPWRDINDSAYDGAVIAGDKSGALATPTISETAYTIALSWFVVPDGSFSLGADQSFALGYAFSGATFSARVPTTRCWLYTGEPSWLYNPKSDLALVGTSSDPFFHLWVGSDPQGLGARLPTGVTDLIVWAPDGAATFVDLPVTSFTDTTVHEVCIQGGPARPDVQVGDWINPNRAQGQWFRISQIDDSTSLRRYRVDLPSGALSPSDVAAVGDLATIAPRTTRDKDDVIRHFLPLILPYDATLFLFYT